MNKRKISIISYIIMTIVVIIMISWTIFKSQKQNEIKQNGRFTYFYIDDIEYSKSMPYIVYHYFYKGIRYVDKKPCTSESLAHNPQIVLGQFLVKTKESLPICNCIVYNIEMEAPLDGWGSLPNGICR